MIIYPYEFFVGSDILDFSFKLPDAMVSVFTEDDRDPFIARDNGMEDYDEDYESTHKYEATVEIIRDRLEIMGYTSERWRSELEDFKQTKLEAERELLIESEDEGNKNLAAARAIFVVEQSKPERWVRTLLEIIREHWGGVGHPRSKVLQKMLFDEDKGTIQIPFSDDLNLLRATIDTHADSEIVRFEFGTAVLDLDIPPDASLSLDARRNLLECAQAFEKIVILTEGKSDSKILKSSLQRIFPHLMHMYSFLDHSSFKAQGGTGELERLARGFAGAGVSNRVVVLFDNDTAGVAASMRLRQAGLPQNFRVLTLPDLDIAHLYPTIGPTGPSHAEINGSACGIELYCGRTALTGEDGQLCPIQWTGYDSAMERYQGEPLEKEKIKERFYQVLESCSDPTTDPEFSSMRLILRTIMQIRW
jgi:hypothetical protein